jgi:hypothetical protein
MATARQENIRIAIDIDAAQGVRAYQRLLDATSQVNREMAALKRAGKENTDEFKRLEAQAEKLNAELKELGGAGANMAQLEKRARELNREMKSLVPGTERFIQAAAELKTVNDRLADIRNQVKGVSAEMKDMQSAPTGFFGAIAGGVNLVGNAMRALVALEIIQWFVQLFDMVAQTTREFADLRRQVTQFTEASGSELDDYTARLAGIARTFGQETQDVLIAANALTKQLTGDFGRSLDLISLGFATGANNSGEFLDMLREYPTFFREAGLSGEQMIAVLSQSVQDGVFSDKGPDLIKEFTIRIRELTPATRAALEGIGITSDEIGRKIQDEGIGGAFTLVQQRLQGLSDTAPEVGAVLADVFGGPGEDAGLQFIRTLDLAQDALDETKNSANQYTAALLDQLQANTDLADAQNRTSKALTDAGNSLSVYITRIKTFLYDVAADVLEFFKDLPATAQGVRAALQQVAQNIANFFERTYISLQILAKRAEKLNPFGKTSAQLDEEIRQLQARREDMARAGESVMGAYRDAYLEGLNEVRTRQAISEALTPPIDERQTRAAARSRAQATARIQAEEDAAAAAQAPQRAAVSPLASLPGRALPSAVASTGEGDGSTEGTETLLRNKFLQALLTEQQYEEQRYQLQQASFERRLAYLAASAGRESQQYIQLENEKLEAQRLYEEQRQELTRRTEEARANMLADGRRSITDFADGVIAALSTEEAARKKNAQAIKAFSIGKVVVDTQEAIMAIVKNAEANPGNILFPGLGAIITGFKVAGVLAKSAASIASIRKQGFYDGGHTGARTLFLDSDHRPVVGAVHANEWVAPSWMVRSPTYAPLISSLEAARQRGFAAGGFTTAVPAIAPTTSTAASGPNADFQQMVAMMLEEQRATREAIQTKRFSVQTGQIRDALNEDYRMDEKSSF